MHKLNLEMELIPGLPDSVAIECLVRIPFDHFSTAASVCRGWKAEIELPEFRRHRRSSNQSQSILVMSQARVDPTRKPGPTKNSSLLAYRLTICEIEKGIFRELPDLPGFPNGLPMFCRLVGVGSDLVVMGGWDPVTWEFVDSVWVYNFVSGSWRRGAHMPGRRRSFFACASSDSDRTVFVAGGHDEDKNALKSAMAYDVARDEWAALPDMASERDECKGVFHGGKFHVIGGYCTEKQGRFERSAEAYDLATSEWGPVDIDFLDVATCPMTCVEVDDGQLYMLLEGNVLKRNGVTWQVIAGMPTDTWNVSCTTAWHNKLMTIGCEKFGKPYVAYEMDLSNYMWTKVDFPEDDYSGHVQSSCLIEI